MIAKKIINIFRINKNRIFINSLVDKKKITYGNFFINIKKISYVLNSFYKLKKGDKTGLLIQNNINFPYFYFSCLISNITIVPININIKAIEFEIIYKDINFDNLIIDNENYNILVKNKIFKKIFNQINLIKSRDVINKIKKLKSSNSNYYHNLEDHKFDNYYLGIFLTSGTTNRPKGVVHTINNMFTNGLLFSNFHKFNKNNTFLSLLPMNYLGGNYNLLLIPFISNSKIILVNSFDNYIIYNFWNYIKKYNVNTIWLVPTLINILVNINFKKIRISKKIKYVLCGTAPISKTLINQFENKFKLKIIQNYGITETLFLTSGNYKNKIFEGVGTKIDKNIRIKIMKLNKNSKTGNIYIKTPNIMKGYFSKDIIKNKFKDNYFETGDTGFFDKNNNLNLTGRIKDLIIVRGINVSPQYIEDIICELTEIRECAVVGINDEFIGEKIIAFIRLQKNIKKNNVLHKVNKHIEKKLDDIKKPKAVEIIGNIPKNLNGKINKLLLRKIAEKKYL